MRRADLITDVDAAVAAPFIVERPRDEWREAYENGLIPPSLWGLYQAADYFSYGQAPSFLDDPERVLFPYFESLAEGLREGLSNAREHSEDIARYTPLIYDPIKEAKGEDWDPAAPKQQRDAFRGLVLDLTSALDLLAELTASILTGEIPGLRLGKAQFRSIQSFLERAAPAATGVIPPRRHYAVEYHSALRPLIVCDPPETEWLDQLYLYRNKLAHLSSSHLPQIGFHDENGVYFNFLSKTWPFSFKQYSGEETPDSETFEEHVSRHFLDIDVIEYSQELYRRVFTIVSSGCEIFVRAYNEFKNGALNEVGREELQGNQKEYQFERFEE